MLNYSLSCDLEVTTNININRFKGQRSFVVNNHTLRAFKGSFGATLDRNFVDFVAHDATANAFLVWLGTNSSIPDESFWQTLYYSLFANYTGERIRDDFLTRFTLWWGDKRQCQGVSENMLCVFGLK